MNSKFLLCISVFAVIIAYSCKKEAGSTVLRVKLTDAPAAFEEVNIDLQEVKIRMNNDSISWITMPTEAGIYNLLALQNGIDTLISEQVLPGGSVSEIRLVLGSNNTIKEGGEIHPLTIPSGSESGLKIKLNKELHGSVDSLTIDFDAALSVREEDGGYKLRPVLRILP